MKYLIEEDMKEVVEVVLGNKYKGNIKYKDSGQSTGGGDVGGGG